MIENIRKYTGLMIVVLVLLFIGLVFLGDSARNMTSGKPVMEVDGQKISQKDYKRLAANPLQISSRLGNAFLPREAQQLASHYVGDIINENPYLGTRGGLIQYMNIALQGDRPDRFLANRLAVQEAGIEYGVTPGPDEVERFVENILFADPEGNFDQKAYSEFIEERIGALGIGIRGFNEYIRDLLTAQNLANIISGDLSVDREVARALYRNEKQTISAQQVILESTSYELEQKPTEEEIKAYWEENQDKYNTDARRKISYVFIEPNWEQVLEKAQKEEAEKKAKAEEARKKQEEARKRLEEEAKKAEEAAKKANEEEATQEETAQDPTTPPTEAPTPPAEGDQGEPGAQGEPVEPTPTPVTPEAAPETTTPSAETTAPESTTPPVKEEKKPAPPEKSAKDQLTPLQKQNAVKELNAKVAEFYNPLVDLSGATFEEHAAKMKIEVKKTEFFTKNKAPKELDLYATNSPLGKLSNIAFAIPADAQNDQLITEPYSTSDGWFVGKLEEVEASRPLSYEEAKVEATVDLKKELAREQLKKEADVIREKLAAALAEGKSFEDAAKELELKVQKLPSLKIPQSRFGRSTIPPAFEAARYTAPGSIADVKFLPSDNSPERAFIVLVDKREVTIDENFSNSLETFIKSQSNGLRLATFQNWLRDRYEENEVQTFFNPEEE